MNKQEIFTHIYCAVITGAAASARGKVTNSNMTIAVDVAHRAVELLEKELEQYKSAPTPAPAPAKRGRPPAKTT